MRERLRFSVHILLFVVVVILGLYVFLPQNYYFSQNALYHVQLAHSYMSGVWNPSSLGILENSSFAEHFIDQHILYHLLMGPFTLLFPGALASKIFMIFQMGILGVLLFIVSRRYLPVHLAFLGSVLVVFSGAAFMGRLFWERPSLLVLIGALVALLLANHKMRFGTLALVVISYLFSMISFETGVIFSACFLIASLKGPRISIEVIAVLFGWTLSFILAPFPGEKIYYFYSLLTHNVFEETAISEWRPANKPLNNMGVFALLWLSACAYKVFQIVRGRGFENSSQKLVFILTLVFSFGTLLVHRMGYLFCLFSYLSFISLYPEVSKVLLPKTRQRLSILLVVLFAVVISRDIVNQGNFRGDSGTAKPLEKFYTWYLNSEYRDEKLVLASWEYWSSLFNYSRQTNAEPGYSLFLYKSSENKKLLDFLLAPWSFTHYEAQGLFEKWESKLLLIEKRREQYNFFKNNSAIWKPVYEDGRFALFRLQIEPLSHVLNIKTFCQGVTLGGYPDVLAVEFDKSIKKEIVLKGVTDFKKSFLALKRLSRAEKEAFVYLPELYGMYAFQSGKNSFQLIKINDLKRDVGRRSTSRYFRVFENSNQEIKESYEIFELAQCEKNKSGEWVNSRFGLIPDANISIMTSFQNSMDFLLSKIAENKHQIPYYFSDNDISNDSRNAQEVRKNLAGALLCSLLESKESAHAKEIEQLCYNATKQQLDAVKDLLESGQHSIGSLATWGLMTSKIPQEMREQWDIQNFYERVIQEVHKSFLIEKKQDVGLFAYGQVALLLLKSKGLSDKELKALIEKYFDEYKKSGKNIFYIRWLGEVLIEGFEQTQNDDYFKMLQTLKKDIEHWVYQDDILPGMKGCLRGDLPGSLVLMTPHHLSGLLVEGIFKGKQSNHLKIRNFTDDSVFMNMLRCALQLQVDTLERKDSYKGVFDAGYLEERYRIDIQSHIANALRLYIENSQAKETKDAFR